MLNKNQRYSKEKNKKTLKFQVIQTKKIPALLNNIFLMEMLSFGKFFGTGVYGFYKKKW